MPVYKILVDGIGEQERAKKKLPHRIEDRLKALWQGLGFKFEADADLSRKGFKIKSGDDVIATIHWSLDASGKYALEVDRAKAASRHHSAQVRGFDKELEKLLDKISLAAMKIESVADAQAVLADYKLLDAADKWEAQLEYITAQDYIAQEQEKAQPRNKQQRPQAAQADRPAQERRPSIKAGQMPKRVTPAESKETEERLKREILSDEFFARPVANNNSSRRKSVQQESPAQNASGDFDFHESPVRNASGDFDLLRDEHDIPDSAQARIKHEPIVADLLHPEHIETREMNKINQSRQQAEVYHAQEAQNSFHGHFDKIAQERAAAGKQLFAIINILDIAEAMGRPKATAHQGKVGKEIRKAMGITSDNELKKNIQILEAYAVAWQYAIENPGSDSQLPMMPLAIHSKYQDMLKGLTVLSRQNDIAIEAERTNRHHSGYEQRLHLRDDLQKNIYAALKATPIVNKDGADNLNPFPKDKVMEKSIAAAALKGQVLTKLSKLSSTAKRSSAAKPEGRPAASSVPATRPRSHAISLEKPKPAVTGVLSPYAAVRPQQGKPAKRTAFTNSLESIPEQPISASRKAVLAKPVPLNRQAGSRNLLAGSSSYSQANRAPTIALRPTHHQLGTVINLLNFCMPTTTDKIRDPAGKAATAKLIARDLGFDTVAELAQIHQLMIAEYKRLGGLHSSTSNLNQDIHPLVMSAFGKIKANLPYVRGNLNVETSQYYQSTKLTTENARKGMRTGVTRLINEVLGNAILTHDDQMAARAEMAREIEKEKEKDNLRKAAQTREAVAPLNRQAGSRNLLASSSSSSSAAITTSPSSGSVFSRQNTVSKISESGFENKYSAEAKSTASRRNSQPNAQFGPDRRTSSFARPRSASLGNSPSSASPHFAQSRQPSKNHSKTSQRQSVSAKSENSGFDLDDGFLNALEISRRSSISSTASHFRIEDEEMESADLDKFSQLGKRKQSTFDTHPEVSQSKRQQQLSPKALPTDEHPRGKGRFR